MTRQYGAQRCQGTEFGRKHRVGTVKVGTVVYLNDPRDIRTLPSKQLRRNPWMVTAWLNREYFPGVRGARALTYMAGGHLAIVRSLRTGEEKRVADWLILSCIEAGLER